jgi:hypothetical protein
MLHNSQYLEGCAIGATDGPIGEVKDLYFDDEAWVIRYLVVSTGSWLSHRKVLISPYAISQPQSDQGLLSARLTKEQVKNSPDIDTDKPISRQYETQYLKYYPLSLLLGKYRSVGCRRESEYAADEFRDRLVGRPIPSGRD